MHIRIANLQCPLVLLLSSALANAEELRLRAGPLSMVFDSDIAMVRYIKLSGHPALQGITAPIRNQHWGTVPPVVENVVLEKKSDAFTLSFDVNCREDDIDFSWAGKIKGTKEGFTYTFDGVAHSTFLRNRIGFCILHGPEAAGQPCAIETVDGDRVKGHFPRFISPHQPFKNIRVLSHQVADGVWAKVRMEGDTFEMEDQRNWTDASFKTYCTPLELPLPVRVTKGAKISQKLEVSFEGVEKLSLRPDAAQRETILSVARDRKARPRFPGIGLQVSSQQKHLSAAQFARLRALQLKHLRVDLSLANEDAEERLARAARQAQQLDVQLHVGLHATEDIVRQLERLKPVLEKIRQPTAWVLVAPNDRQLAATRSFLTSTGQRGRLGVGHNTNFTELNRMRPDPEKIDLLAYGVNPQIHAFDNTSMVETLAIQGDTVHSARQFSGRLPLFVSPITLKPQSSLVAVDGKLPASVDARQPTRFASVWTLGSIKYLAEARVESLTYYETVGWLGVIESEQGSPLADQFPSHPNQLFPVYHVLHALSDFAGAQVHPTTSSDPMSMIGLTVQEVNRRRLLIGNLSPNQRRARVQWFANRATARPLMDDQSIDLNAKDGELVVDLPAHGVVVLDAR